MALWRGAEWRAEGEGQRRAVGEGQRRGKTHGQNVFGKGLRQGQSQCTLLRHLSHRLRVRECESECVSASE